MFHVSRFFRISAFAFKVEVPDDKEPVLPMDLCYLSHVMIDDMFSTIKAAPQNKLDEVKEEINPLSV